MRATIPAVPAASALHGAAPSRGRVALLGLAVALVLADSSVVTLALPEILREFRVDVSEVAWVLTAYNLVLALTAVPAAWLARRVGAGRVAAAGALIFAGASLACALATSLDPLVTARAIQAVGGAAVVCAALELLARETGSDARAAGVWAAGGVAGAALGPAIGGILTQAVSWEAIFAVQVPLALAVLLALPGRLGAPARAPAPAGRPRPAPNLALLLLSAALTAALFLLVILMIEGWLMEPAAAGFAVTVMPLAALAGGWASRRLGSHAVRAATGTILIGGGLAGLGLMAGATWTWTILPQILIGLGLGLTISALTDAALHGRSHQVVHGGWTIASRHAGVVLGLLLLTPIFTADLKRNTRDAELAGTALLLDADLAPDHKLDLAQALAKRLRASGGRLPTLEPVFAANPAKDSEAAAQAKLQGDLQGQIERAATDAFSRSFLAAAFLGLLALIPIGLGRREVEL